MEHHQWKIIGTQEEFDLWKEQVFGPIAVDVETKGKRPTQEGSRLLGTAITGHADNNQYISAYVLPSVDVTSILEHNLIGWNVPFDKMWLDHHYKVDTQWKADGRILWHLQNNDPTIRGFGLKLAQEKLLGWEKTNDKELEENVAAKGGRLKNGDHYMADLDMLARYACLDTLSTLKAYKYLSHWIDRHDYWWFAKEILDYSIELNKASSSGIPVNVLELERAAKTYEEKREAAAQELRVVCKPEIDAIEESWKIKRASTYKTDRGRDNFLLQSETQRRFNPSSGPQRALLLHTLLEFPVRETTPTGRPKTDRLNLGLIRHPGAEALLRYSEYKKIAEQARTYLEAVENEDVYTNYDVCGTVSGRLAGFRPSVLNMPFSEEEVMHAFPVIEGYIGVHADLASIEPCVLAHYSDDPTLQKVYRDGLGDIYLDLALDVFPDNQDLKDGYNHSVPIISAVKERFKEVRNICKTLHLALSYTGSYITIAKNLNKQGYPTTNSEAMQLVKRYWQKFVRVKSFERQLLEVYNDRHSIRNLTGRVVTVPREFKKDLLNRLIQSSAHDVLRLWVTEIIKQFKEQGIDFKHHLPDLHDSTSFMVRVDQAGQAEAVYKKSLQIVQERLKLSVPLKMEFKKYLTLAGLKGKE